MAFCQQCGKGPTHTVVLNGKKIVCGDCLESGLTEYNTCFKCGGQYKHKRMDEILRPKCRKQIQ